MEYSKDFKWKNKILENITKDYWNKWKNLFWDMSQFLTVASNIEINTILQSYNTEKFKLFIDSLNKDKTFKWSVDKVRFYIKNVLESK